jgi:20S proteasome alpha/beta subunit
VENLIEPVEAANVLHLRRKYRARANPIMTIALGMRLKDGGIILGADRLLSTERHHFTDEKLTLYPTNNGIIFFAFADSPVTAREVRQKIEAQVTALPESETTLEKLGQLSEEVINDVYAKRLGAMPLQLLIVGAVPGEGTQMWFYDGEGGFNIASQFVILGAGESSLIRYLERAYSWTDSIESAENVAIYLIHQAEQFIPGCKGIDIMSISNDEDWNWLNEREIEVRLEVMKAREKDQLRKIVTG